MESELVSFTLALTKEGTYKTVLTCIDKYKLGQVLDDAGVADHKVDGCLDLVDSVRTVLYELQNTIEKIHGKGAI